MTIRKKQPYGPVSSRKLKAFESKLVAPLPDDFRSFLLEFNGAEFVWTEDDSHPDDDNEHRPEEIYGLHKGPTDLRLDEMGGSFQPALPASILIFASDGFGNYFGISLTKPKHGVVYWIDHEAPSRKRKVASSFTEFIEAAGTDLEPPRVSSGIADAIDAEDVTALRRLIKNGASGLGYVFDAVRTENLPIVKTILEAGGDPNERGGLNDSETPLFHAARVDNKDLAKLLLKYGADPNARCSVGGTAMEAATYFPSVLEVLARAGAEPTTKILREAVQKILGRK